jgi:hypothetical protein
VALQPVISLLCFQSNFESLTQLLGSVFGVERHANRNSFRKSFVKKKSVTLKKVLIYFEACDKKIPLDLSKE